MKKILIISVIVGIIIISSILLVSQNSINPSPIQKSTSKADIVMTPQSSRPGCDKTDSCYVPSKLTIPRGGSVTWQNQDSGFHTVTSGKYENPDGLFDSGHIDPDNSFSYTFNTSGTFDFFCTLHPWMYGVITVQ